MNKCAITIDVDMNFGVDGNGNKDCLGECFDKIKDVLTSLEEVKTTWFIRIDSGIEEKYGDSTYILKKYCEQIKWLWDNGHQLGWHAHCKYGSSKYIGMEEKERTKLIIAELDKYINMVSKYNLQKYFRMGSCLMNDRIMEYLENIGVEADCSALPRPVYPWVDKMIRWENASQIPYFPRIDNYQITSQNKSECRTIKEIPMTTTRISASYDSLPDIIRYINPAYKNIVFCNAVKQINNDCVLIMHPEDMWKANKTKHELLAYSDEVLKDNLKVIRGLYKCVTVKEYIQK